MPEHAAIAAKTGARFGPGRRRQSATRIDSERAVATVRNPFLFALAAFSILLIRLPVYYGHNRLFKVTVLVLLLMGIMALVPLLHHRLMRGSMWLSALYVGVIAVEIIRGAKQGAFSDVTSGA